MLQAGFLAQMVSIHAPARGATVVEFSGVFVFVGFNSRSREGSDSQRIKTLSDITVSIHAPARGATPPQLLQNMQQLRFNSRSREGSDASGSFSSFVGIVFQFTLPRGERLLSSSYALCQGDVSIHAPARGATLNEALLYTVSVFQFTLPRGERLASETLRSPHLSFQFTLPRGERHYAKELKTTNVLFQFTLPRGERLLRLSFVMSSYEVSIHAPARGATSLIQP
mgnify:CR=1 FL=1